jgi:hypothetical protein
VTRRAARGSAVLEFTVVAPALLAIVTLTLVAGYLVLARAWLEYQSEQALYCLATGRARKICGRDFTRRIHETLGFGRVVAFTATRRPQSWSVRVEWQLAASAPFVRDPTRFRFERTLTLARVLRTEVR